MAYNTQVDILEPVNLAEHLEKIELYLGQVCQIAGISKMQLDYWTNKAQIPTKGKKQRIYDIGALEHRAKIAAVGAHRLADDIQEVRAARLDDVVVPIRAEQWAIRFEVAVVCCDRIDALQHGEEVRQQIDEHSAGARRGALPDSE